MVKKIKQLRAVSNQIEHPISNDTLNNTPGKDFEITSIPEPHEIEVLNRPGPLIRRLHQIAVSVFLSQGKEFELTPVQYGSIQLVDMYPGIHQAGLGKMLGLDRQTISNVVQRLSDKGLLIKKEKDARSSALYASGSAKALIQVMRERLAEVDSIILEPLSTNEASTFMRLLHKLVDTNNELSRAPTSGPNGVVESRSTVPVKKRASKK